MSERDGKMCRNEWGEAIIEGDALAILKKCQRDQEDKSEIRAYIRNIKHISKQINGSIVNTFRGKQISWLMK